MTTQTATLPTTAREIIARSLAMHPSLFEEALVAQARQHNHYAVFVAGDGATARAAAGMARDCMAASTLTPADLDTLHDRTGVLVCALNVAGKLQCLPRHVVTQAAALADPNLF